MYKFYKTSGLMDMMLPILTENSRLRILDVGGGHGGAGAAIRQWAKYRVDYECIDCLDEERNPGLREAIKELSVWPTIPQVYIGGEFTGGADVCRELMTR